MNMMLDMKVQPPMAVGKNYFHPEGEKDELLMFVLRYWGVVGGVCTAVAAVVGITLRIAGVV